MTNTVFSLIMKSKNQNKVENTTEKKQTHR